MQTENKKVLLIEDEESVLNIIERYLEKADVTVLRALNGKVGLEVALQEKPHLILLDLRLPVMNGIIFLEELRKDSWGKEAIVVTLTNDPTEEAVNVTKHLGIKEYIVKSNWPMEVALNRALVFIGKKINIA